MSEVMFMPKELSDVERAFGGKMSELLPEWGEIPESFRDMNDRSKWSQLVSDWFYCGLKGMKLAPKEGIDANKAIRHIKAILASWEPKHEHKFAGCAYLMSLWFDDAKWERAK